MSKNEIILRNPKQRALVKATQQSQTFLTLLQQSDEQRLIELLKTISFNKAVELISGLEHIKWTAQFIEKYAEYWDCSSFSQNKALPWSIELIERFKEHWVWQCLAFNEKVQQIFTALSVQGIEEVMDYHIKNENL